MDKQWEYLIRMCDNKDEAEFDKLGLVGWELVAVTADQDYTFAYFKRERQNG